MIAFIEVPCPCGRMIRATTDQAGSIVRCWNCKADVLVPSQSTAKKIVSAFASAVRRTLQTHDLNLVFGAAFVLTIVLMIPFLGNFLGFGLLVIGARLYQSMIRENVPPARAGGPDEVGDSLPPDAIAWLVSTLAASALLAPFWARDWTLSLIIPARWPLIALGYLGWLVVPIGLFLFNAVDRLGSVPPREALRALRKHPLATLAAVLILPVAFLLIEAATATLARAEGYLCRMVEENARPPIFESMGDRLGKIYTFDDLERGVPFGLEEALDRSLYRSALSRGYTLAGTIPRRLATEIQAGPSPASLADLDVSYLTLRALMTLMILTLGCLALSIQARWFGLIALLETRASEPTPIGAADPILSDPPVPSPSLAPVSVAKAALHAPTTAPTILIVDADRYFAVDLGRTLSERGFGVILSGSATEALSIVRGTRPDLIVVDTSLPDRSGIDFCKEVRSTQTGPDRPLLIATTSRPSPAEISAMATAADDYTIKPYVIDALIQRINQQLRNRV